MGSLKVTCLLLCICGHVCSVAGASTAVLGAASTGIHQLAENQLSWLPACLSGVGTCRATCK